MQDLGPPNPKARSADLVAAGTRPGAVARLDATMVEAVTSTAERAYGNPGMLLPATPQFAEQVDTVFAATKADMETGAEQAAIRDFLTLFAERRNLPLPSSLALDLDTATMAQWPQDLFVKAARLVWERFAELRAKSTGFSGLYRRGARGPSPGNRRAAYASETAGDHCAI
jgi:hypothetical protein